MIEDRITAGTSDHWSAYVVDQGWAQFTADDHAVWDYLFERQSRLLRGRVVREFLEGIDLLRLDRPGIPELGALNQRLTPRTGWRTVAVPGLVPEPVFFNMLIDKVFPIGNFIRTRAELDYLEAPDCFHDLFGHIPMYAHPNFTKMVEHVGHLGLAACQAGEVERVARLYWHSVEFGLAREDGALKILGSGLASSFGEAPVSLESDTVERRPFSCRAAINTPYRYDAFQPLYFVSESVASTISAICALTPEEMLKL